MKPDFALVHRIPALRRHLAVCIAAAVATAIAIVTQAQVLASGLPRVIHGDARAVGALVVGLVVVGAVRGLASWATGRSSARAMGEVRIAITSSVVARLDELDDDAAARLSPSAAATLCTSGVDATEPWVADYLPAVCLAATVPIVAGLRILVADAISAGILLVAIPLIPVFMVLIGRLTAERTHRQWAVLQRLGAHFHDVLVGLETLRLFGRAEAQVDGVRRVTGEYRQAMMRTLRVAFLSALTLELLATMSVALVAVSAGVRLAGGHLSLETALLVLLLAPECSTPLRRVGAAYHSAEAGNDALSELETLDSLTTTPDGPRPGRIVGPIRVEAARVDGGGRGHRVGPANIVVQPGELVVVQGATGSGKSTLLGAIAGTVPLTSGRIDIGGRALAEWSRASRRAAIVRVPQHPHALGTSVIDSVALGNGPVSRSECVAALEAVDLGALAERDPSELSGGERQRLAVARAVLATEVRDARYLLADEPTAHLDAERTHLVIAALRDAADRGVAVVVATHDPLVAHAADRVLVLAADQSTTRPASRSAIATSTVASVRHRPTHLGAATPAEPTPAARAPIPADAHPGAIGDLVWFRRLVPGTGGRSLGARALGISAEGATVGLAASAAWLIFRAAQHPSFEALTVVAVAVRAFGIAKGFLRYGERIASHDTTLRRLAEVRAAVVERLAVLVPAGLPAVGRGELLASVTDDVDRLADFDLRVAGPAISAWVVTIALAVGLLVVAAPAGVVVLLGASVAGLALPLAAGRAAARTARELVDAKAHVTDGVVDLAERAGEVASLGAVPEWSRRIDGAARRVAHLDGRRRRVTSVATGLATAVPIWVAAATVAALGAAGPGRSGIVIGVAVLSPLAAMDLFAPAVTGAELFSTVIASASRLRALLSRPDPAPEPAVPAAPGAQADVALSGAAFGWPGGPDVIDRIDFALPEGTRVAVRGPSGSGKSTLAAGLVGFLQPRRGSYRVGGIDADRLGGRTLRTLVTWSQQEPWLANTSIRENLRIADPDSDDERLWQVLALVRLAEWVAAMPAGLDTLLGPDAATASGGQRQRLALARVVLAGHRVVVLDEPTAHLDLETAQELTHDLLTALDGRTLVVIAHDAIGFDVDLVVDMSTANDELGPLVGALSAV